MPQPLPDQTVARFSPLSFSASPPTIEPSLLTAHARDTPELSAFNVPRSVVVVQPLPDQTMARDFKPKSFAYPAITEPSLLTEVADELSKLSTYGAPRSVLVVQPLPDQTVAWVFGKRKLVCWELPTTTEASSLTAYATELPELSLLSVPRSVLVVQPLPDQTVACFK